MCIMNNEHQERRSSSSIQASPSLPPYRSTAFSRSSWSLPSSSSPKMCSVYPFPSVLQLAPPNSFAPPHQIAPPAPHVSGDIPNPEVYAQAYDMLRQRWVGREGEIASGESMNRTPKRRLDDSTALRTHALRRASIAPPREDALKSVVAVVKVSPNESTAEEEEEEEEGGHPLKRSKTSSSEDNLISFFDNPPPVMPAFDDEGFRRPSLPLHHHSNRRSHSLSPRLEAATAPRPPCSSLSSRTDARATTTPRKRSVSQPCETRPHSPSSSSPPPNVATARRRRFEEPQLASSTRVSASCRQLPPSRSAPVLSDLVPHLPTPTTTTTTTRSEALLHVVKSFEAVLACRAEGWRRLANRKLSSSAAEPRGGVYYSPLNPSSPSGASSAALPPPPPLPSNSY